MTITEAQMPETVRRLKAALDEKALAHRIHRQDINAATAQSGVELGYGSLEQMAPTFIVRTPASAVAVIISGATRLSYKKLKAVLGVKDAKLAAPEEVERLTGSPVGAVSMLQPELKTIVDERVMAQPVIFGGCGAPHYTLEIAPHDLVAASRAVVADVTGPRQA